MLTVRHTDTTPLPRNVQKVYSLKATCLYAWFAGNLLYLASGAAVTYVQFRPHPSNSRVMSWGCSST